MKKVICAFMTMLLVSSASFAQSAASAASAGKKNITKSAPMPSAAAASTPKDSKEVPSQKLKKDGTPDMRHAENKKAAEAPTQKLKKDGTPDMRYSENKKANPAKTSAPAKKAK